MGKVAVFIYGTLMSDRIMKGLIDRVPEMYTAKIEGYRRHKVFNVHYPAIKQVNNNDSYVLGKIIYVDNTIELLELDDYEGSSYKKIQVNASLIDDNSVVNAIAYEWCDDDSLLLDESWDEEKFLNDESKQNELLNEN
eukprot:TRINITY_DN120211_c0_g1_i1.p1 TRINITY_DN120211_c0_g1~~TRINITY_DN120211_c0_g1_i1.p1  ORF type:complete len:138 (+),score=0.38 TRINITY_DN120211_c0_g1_i1:35-448(+)